MKQNTFKTYILPEKGNLTYSEDKNGDLISNKFEATLQSAINPNHNKDKDTYWIKQNKSNGMFFLCSTGGYIESVEYMGSGFGWSIWLHNK